MLAEPFTDCDADTVGIAESGTPTPERQLYANELAELILDRYGDGFHKSADQ